MRFVSETSMELSRMSIFFSTLQAHNPKKTYKWDKKIG